VVSIRKWETSLSLPSNYNVVWESQSRDSSESMPCGGHDVGLNVWVENDDVLFYIDRSGSFDENNQMLKLGRVRLRLSPSPFETGAAFRQELNLAQGYVEITITSRQGAATLIRIWAEVDRPVVRVNVTSDSPRRLSAWYENWRTQAREVPHGMRHPCLSYYGYPGKVTTWPDEIAFNAGGVVFYHRNRSEHLLTDLLIEQQGLTAVRDQIPNFQKDFTFGGCLSGPGMSHAGVNQGVYGRTPFTAWELRSDATRPRHDLSLCFHAGQLSDLETWHAQLDALCKTARTDEAQARTKAARWWQEFWERSHIRIQPDAPDPADAGWQVGRNYQLFRYMLACNAHGSHPTKFNGGLFTFDPCFMDEYQDVVDETPDYRSWGGGSSTAQNQRLVYWPMLKSGDFDMMPPQFDLYRRALPGAEARTRFYWGHGGCSFVEQLENCGLPIAWGWGWKDSTDPNHLRPEHFDPTEIVGPWIRYEYSTQIEFALMILRYHQYTGLDISDYLPLIHSSLRFFDEHYQYIHRLNTIRPLNTDGKLVIFPSTALETYKNATDPTDVLSGLPAAIEALLALGPSMLSDEDRAYYRGFLSRIPDLNFRTMNGKKTIAPAKSWSDIINMELPQLYPVFPNDQFGLHNQLQVAIDTWRHGVDNEDQRGYVSWHQDNIFCARLGLIDEAVELTIKKLGDSGRRFPAFWGPGHDGTPDHNWAGSGMIGLQEMMLQTFGRDIWLLPAWPRKWDVDFKLHAPFETTIEASVRGGKIVRLVVTPEERRKDIVHGLPPDDSAAELAVDSPVG
jgi:hypothetical protein